MSENNIGRIEFGPSDASTMRERKREFTFDMVVHDAQFVIKLEEKLASLESLNAQLQRDLEKYTTHDHAPCIYCDPLRQQVARLREALSKAVSVLQDDMTKPQPASRFQEAIDFAKDALKE